MHTGGETRFVRLDSSRAAFSVSAACPLTYVRHMELMSLVETIIVDFRSKHSRLKSSFPQCRYAVSPLFASSIGPLFHKGAGRTSAAVVDLTDLYYYRKRRLHFLCMDIT